MMGHRQVEQGALFYEFSLERHVPADHLLRSIDRFVSSASFGGSWRPSTASGRPSIDPELMIRMLIVGYCFGIRSERRLCEEVHLNLGVPVVLPPRPGWRCARPFDLLQEPTRPFPRERSAAACVRDRVRRCIDEGLVGGKILRSMPA